MSSDNLVIRRSYAACVILILDRTPRVAVSLSATRRRGRKGGRGRRRRENAMGEM